jgi:hypothetical protein
MALPCGPMPGAFICEWRWHSWGSRSAGSFRLIGRESLTARFISRRSYTSTGHCFSRGRYFTSSRQGGSRPHQVYVYGGALVVLEGVGAVVFSNTQAWMSTAKFLEGLGG